MIRALAAGDAAVLLEPAAAGPAALAAAITAAALPGVLDVIPGATTVLVSFEPGALDPDELATPRGARLPRPRPAAGRPAARRSRSRSATTGLTCLMSPRSPGCPCAEVIERHQAAGYEVGWLGFSPGFGYLTGLDPVLAAVPRLDTPRLAVPAGSVAIAGGLAAVYPAASPGGWRIIGRTNMRLWDQERAAARRAGAGHAGQVPRGQRSCAPPAPESARRTGPAGCRPTGARKSCSRDR